MSTADIMGLRNKRCPSCKKTADFFYRGTQEGFGKISDSASYVCSKCRTFVLMSSLKKENPGMY